MEYSWWNSYGRTVIVKKLTWKSHGETLIVEQS